ncbi:MAG: hypothetical protein D3910_14540, partial [Candidatus Electrothrix sp. ATG2]|nr:hypothetical protein [Candidatus Electrothrix sp. ATG2]
MKNSFANLAFADLPTPLPPGTIQFFDGFYPSLVAGTYEIGLQQTVTPNKNKNITAPTFKVTQTFQVQGPEFFIDSNEVASCYPPPGAAGIYDSILPFVVLNNPALPWERDLRPTSSTVPTGPKNPAWMALLIFTENEIVFDADSHSSSVSKTVGDFLAKDATTLKPILPNGWVSTTIKLAGYFLRFFRGSLIIIKNKLKTFSINSRMFTHNSAVFIY